MKPRDSAPTTRSKSTSLTMAASAFTASRSVTAWFPYTPSVLAPSPDDVTSSTLPSTSQRAFSVKSATYGDITIVAFPSGPYTHVPSSSQYPANRYPFRFGHASTPPDDIPASGTYLVKIGNHAARRIVMIR